MTEEQLVPMTGEQLAALVQQAAAVDPAAWEAEIHLEYCKRSAQYFRHLLAVAPLTYLDHLVAVGRAVELGEPCPPHWSYYERVAAVAQQGLEMEGVAAARRRRQGPVGKKAKARAKPERRGWLLRAGHLWRENPKLSINKVAEIIYTEGEYDEPKVHGRIRYALKGLKPKG